MSRNAETSSNIERLLAKYEHLAHVQAKPEKVEHKSMARCSQYYNLGWSLARVAQKIGCSTFKVRSHLIRQGVKMRRPGRRLKVERKDAAKVLVDLNFPLVTVARALNTTVYRVKQLLKEAA